MAQTIGKAYHTPRAEWMTWGMYHRATAEVIGAPPQLGLGAHGKVEP